MNGVYASATELATAIRAHQLTAVEALETHLARIDAHNPALNAVVTLDAESARRRAREADEALARGEVWGPLHGVPYTLKDAHATAGIRTTVGFPPFDHIPQADSTVAARLKAAGGILMGKTNVHLLLGDALQTANPIFGRTNNPWDSSRTPGGSSGGAAAAVAAGMTPFDVGSDLAGSIRIPAHFCGVFGLKPTENRVPGTGFFPDPYHGPRSIRLMSSLGPIARSIDDLALVYSIIAGPDGRDSEVQPVPTGDMAAIELEGLRVAVVSTFPGLPVTADIRNAIQQLANQLEGAGALVDEAALPALDFAAEGAASGELIGMVVGAFQPQEQPVALAHYLEALHRRDQSIYAWEQFFESWDVLLCPASMTSAFPHCEPGSPLNVDGQEISYWMGNAHSALFNYTGHPAVVLPYTQDREGMPIGIQLVGKRWAEGRLLGMAKAIVALGEGFKRPPGF